VRTRLLTFGLYALAIGTAGVYLVLAHPDAVRGAIERLRNCSGCQRRREAVQRMMRQAQDAVGVHVADD
jgi:hypothetical protein